MTTLTQLKIHEMTDGFFISTFYTERIASNGKLSRRYGGEILRKDNKYGGKRILVHAAHSYFYRLDLTDSPNSGSEDAAFTHGRLALDAFCNLEGIPMTTPVKPPELEPKKPQMQIDKDIFIPVFVAWKKFVDAIEKPYPGGVTGQRQDILRELANLDRREFLRLKKLPASAWYIPKDGVNE